jgi:type IV pilus assembly protein PilE
MKAFVNLSPVGRNQRAFTLIEMMIVAAVIAILAAIALPSYNSYIIKSEIRTAQADLLALSLNFENRYQRRLEYPEVPTNTTAGLEGLFQGWHPSAKDSFSYSVPNRTSSTYTLKATGTGRQSGCSITITNENIRSSAGCKHITAGDWL